MQSLKEFSVSCPLPLEQYPRVLLAHGGGGKLMHQLIERVFVGAFGNPVADAEKPLEVLRTIHSFDPCLACAVHTLDPEGREIAKVKVL
jgi:hypothetical protein